VGRGGGVPGEGGERVRGVEERAVTFIAGFSIAFATSRLSDCPQLPWSGMHQVASCRNVWLTEAVHADNNGCHGDIG
jgi:hypothetical protein